MTDVLIELWPFALGLMATGLIAGVIAGLLGVGGGIVIVPVLYSMFGVIGIDEGIRMHLAVGTSLATIIPTSIRSLRSHAKRGAVDWALLKRWAPGILFGVFLGTVLAGYFNSKALTGIFAVVGFIVALNMAFGKKDWQIANALPKGLSGAIMTCCIGGVSALMGIGGGTLGVPLMTLYGYDAKRAVATASGFGLIISVPGAIGFVVSGWGEAALPALSLGYVSLVGLAIIAPMTVITAPLGVHFAHAMPQERLKQAFALFLAITAIKMASNVLS